MSYVANANRGKRSRGAYVSACSGLYQQLSWSQAADPICHLLEPTKRHMFSKKRYMICIYYVQTMSPENEKSAWHDGLLFKRHWQPARGHHTLRPVPPTGKLTSSDMRYPGYPAPKPQYLQNTSNLTQ